jgi:hypothetical protein
MGSSLIGACLVPQAALSKRNKISPLGYFVG